jgi:hypothetical protein
MRLYRVADMEASEAPPRPDSFVAFRVSFPAERIHRLLAGYHAAPISPIA